MAVAAIHSGLHSRTAIGLPPSIPLTPLSSGRLRLRSLNTDTHSSTGSSSPPPPIPQGQAKDVVHNSRAQVATTPPLGSSPPSPPLPVESIPPKIAEVAAEKVEKELATKKEEKPKGTAVSRAWATVKKEASHYWHGTKLLGQEIKISAKLQWKVLQGATLTRRERRQVSCPATWEDSRRLTHAASKNNCRFAPPYPVLAFRPHPLHGVPVARCP